MTTRRLQPEDWAPIPKTRIFTRTAREPRDELLRIPKTAQRPRPAPINIAPSETPPWLRAPSLMKGDTAELCEAPREPEIVDIAAPSTWPRRMASQKQAFPLGVPSSRVTSPCSPRQSEVSYGILDYYIRDPSPLQSPTFAPPTPRLETPILDPAMEEFDFGLLPMTPSPHLAKGSGFDQVFPNTKPGARRESGVLPELTPSAPIRPSIDQKNTYRLFPVIKDLTPPRDVPQAPDSQSPQSCMPTANITGIPSHQQHDPSYRPRKESLSSSVRSRKDIFNSFCGTKRIPMRILSGGSTTSTSKTKSTISTSASPTSPPQQSRWSDDIITSPVAATTPGPRASFGSLLGRDSAQYPACFFEDDDEAAPLRRKFAWKRSASLMREEQASIGGRGSFGRQVKRVLLRAVCCGAR